MHKKVYNTRSKSKIRGGNLRHIVDAVLQKYCKFEPEFLHFVQASRNFTNEWDTKDDENKCMKSLNVVINEINSELWEKALVSSLGEISPNFYPHYTAIQKYIDFALNSNLFDPAITKCLFSKLVFFHPPNTLELQSYYWEILSNKYTTFKSINVECGNILWFVVEALISCYENPDGVTDVPGQGCYDYKIPEKKFDPAELLRRKVTVEETLNWDRTTFEIIATIDKLRRLLIILEFLYDIFQADFVHRQKMDPVQCGGSRCFFSVLLWEDANDIGSATYIVSRLIDLFKLTELSRMTDLGQVHRKLFILVAEVVRHSDSGNNLYPFFGNNGDKLACNLASKFIDENYTPENTSVLRVIRPHWLRLLLCSKLMSNITGRICPPELSAVNDILQSVVSLTSRSSFYEAVSENKSPETKKRKVNKYSEHFNVEIQPCHSGCYLMERKKNKTLRLTEKDINALDDNGWAPLHRAALLGHEKCVENLSNYQPSCKKNQKNILDPRVKGFNKFTPLMCAVIKEQGNICRLLLQRFGSVLLEDVDLSGNSPLEICQDSSIRRIIRSFGKISLPSGDSQELHINSYNVMVVTELCVDLAESYFETYRTLDVSARWNIYMSNGDDSDMKKNEQSIGWDYERYENDINVNIKNYRT